MLQPGPLRMFPRLAEPRSAPHHQAIPTALVLRVGAGEGRVLEEEVQQRHLLLRQSPPSVPRPIAAHPLQCPTGAVSTLLLACPAHEVAELEVRGRSSRSTAMHSSWPARGRLRSRQPCHHRSGWGAAAPPVGSLSVHQLQLSSVTCPLNRSSSSWLPPQSHSQLAPCIQAATRALCRLLLQGGIKAH